MDLNKIVKDFNPSDFEFSNGFCSPAFCDWLRLSVPGQIDSIVEFLSKYDLKLIDLGDKSFHGYNCSMYDATYKSRIGYGGLSTIPTFDRVLIDLPGQYVRHLQTKGVFLEFCKNINSLFPGLRCNRFDLTKDCFNKNIFGWLRSSTPGVEAKKIWSPLKRDPRVPRLKNGELAPGFTYYLGQRGGSGSVFIRIYDKAAQADIDCECWHRFEFELTYVNKTNCWADTAFKMFCDGISLSDLFLYVAKLKFLILKGNHPNSIRHIQDRFESYINPSYKNFLFAYTENDVEFIKNKLYAKEVFCEELFLEKISVVDLWLQISKAISQIDKRFVFALSNKTIPEILRLFDEVRLKYTEKLLKDNFVLDEVGERGSSEYIPFFLSNLDIWDNPELIEKLPALSDAEPQQQFFDEIHESDYRLL